MKSIQDSIRDLRECWSKPRPACHRGKVTPFLLHCDFFPAHGDGPSGDTAALPEDLAEFWKYAGHANLFVDARYGQWGLEILDLQNAQAKTFRQCAMRPRDFEKTDLVVGRFLGDSDLLLIRNDKSAMDFGSVLVALPIDNREDWEVVSTSFSSFLEKLADSQGDKFWEK